MVKGLLFLSGALPDTTRNAISVYGIITAYRLAVLLLLLFMPFMLISYSAMRRDCTGGIIGIYTCISVLTTVYFCLFSTVAVNENTSRYFITPLLFCVVSAVIYYDRPQQVKFKWILAILFIPIVLDVSFNELLKPGFAAENGKVHWLKPRQENQFDPLIRELQNRGLTYGYATYWNANVITVLSNGNPAIRPVYFKNNGEIVPFRHLSDKKWYSDTAYTGRTILVLSNEQRGVMHGKSCAALGSLMVQFNVGQFTVLVYEMNIASRLPFWEGRSIDAPLIQYLHKIKLISRPEQIVPGNWAIFEFEVDNLSNEIYSSSGKMPVNLGAHLLDQNGRMINYDFGREALSGDILPGQSQRIVMPMRFEQPGHYRLVFDLVQESVTWFAGRGSSELAVDVDVKL
jgi:hypothetical protein